MNTTLNYGTQKIEQSKIFSQISNIISSHSLLKYDISCTVDTNNINITIENLTLRNKSKNIFDKKHSTVKFIDSKLDTLRKLYIRYLEKQIAALYYAYKSAADDVSDIDKLCIVRLLGILSLEKVKFVDELEILDIISQIQRKFEPLHRDIIFEKERPTTPIEQLGYVDAMGCYCKEEKTIYICIDNISKVAYELSIDDENLLEIVFYHELGHAVFAYHDLPFDLNGRKKQERQANYIASDATSGKFDTVIKQLSEEQLPQYKNPLLSKEFYVFEKKPLDHKEYKETCEEYEKSVKNLYIN